MWNFGRIYFRYLTVVGANQAIQAIQNDQIKISLNGQVQAFKDETTGEIQYPLTYHDRTYLPLRNVAQLSGLSVDYDYDTNTAILEDRNYLDFSKARQLFSENNQILEDCDAMDYFLTDNGDTLYMGDTMRGCHGFDGKVVAAIAVVKGDPSPYEFPLYVLNDKGDIYTLDIGSNEFRRIYVDLCVYSDIAVIETYKMEIVQSPYSDDKNDRMEVFALHYEVYGKDKRSEGVTLIDSGDLWS